MESKFQLIKHSGDGARTVVGPETIDMISEDVAVINVALCAAKSPYRFWAFLTHEQIRAKYEALNLKLKGNK